MDKVQQEADQLYKLCFGKMVASLLHFSRAIDPETAEDIVQDSFSVALTDWRQHGIPANPSGWIYKVCRNKALNQIKKDKRINPLIEQSFPVIPEMRINESGIDDEQLTLLFACAHPDLSPKTQVVITLKYVINLRVDSIAKILGMTIDGVDKLLVRARKKIKDEKIILEEPHPEALRSRLSIVHKIIYLTFNEGYKSSGGKEILREQLCEDALLLNKALLDSALGNPETKALHALMLFNAARFEARFSSSGDLMDLENQDRSLWNRNLILLAQEFLNRSQNRFVSTYHLEAAIACVHSLSKSFETTDWKLIAGLYVKLLRINPNPFVELNYAIALYYAGEKIMAFKILQALQKHAFLNQYYLLSMALGKFHYLEGDTDRARDFLMKACQQATAEKEKQFIQQMINKFKETEKTETSGGLY